MLALIGASLAKPKPNRRSARELREIFLSNTSLSQYHSYPRDTQGIPLHKGNDKAEYAVSTYSQFKMIIHRKWTSYSRSGNDVIAPFVVKGLLGLIMGTCTRSIFVDNVDSIILGLVYYHKAKIEMPFYHNGVLSAQAMAINGSLMQLCFFSVILSINSIPAMIQDNALYRYWT
jgi:hypothetical protein